MTDARLLIDPPFSGPENMARDEALLGLCTEPASPITLRFYAWSPPTISLGYFQTYDEFKSLAPPAGDVAVVRRTTGGGAILHDLELTYALVVPLAHPLVRGRPNMLYRLAHDAIICAVGHGVHMLGCDNSACDAASQRGPFFCFARRHGLDVVITDAATPQGYAKLAGSAQRRTRTAILQHGSIMLDGRFPQQPVATWRDLEARPITFDEAAHRLAPAFAAALDLRFKTGAWSAMELAAAEPHRARYADTAWTMLRQRES